MLLPEISVLMKIAADMAATGHWVADDNGDDIIGGLGGLVHHHEVAPIL